jgi:hypothetical protein
MGKCKQHESCVKEITKNEVLIKTHQKNIDALFGLVREVKECLVTFKLEMKDSISELAQAITQDSAKAERRILGLKVSVLKTLGVLASGGTLVEAARLLLKGVSE